MRRLVRTLAILPLLALAACDLDDEKPIFMAPGSYGDIAVVVSSAPMAASLREFEVAVNEEYTFVIARESLFNIDIYTPDEWELCKGYKNIVFVWRVGDGGPVEKMLRKRLTDEGERLAAAGGGTMMEMEEPFSNYQHALIVTGTDRNSLLSYLCKNAPKIRGLFERKSSSRIMRRYRHEGLNTQLMADLWIRYRFFMEIPAVLKLNQDSPDGYPGVELMQTGPSRGITVAWSHSVDPEFLFNQRSLLVELRRELGLKLHHEDIIDESFVWTEDDVDGRPAWRLEGAWNSRSFDGGGPFWCWFVADPEHQRVICIDALCYAPGMEKMDFFRRMRTIVQTFSLSRPQP